MTPRKCGPSRVCRDLIKPSLMSVAHLVLAPARSSPGGVALAACVVLEAAEIGAVTGAATGEWPYIH